MSVDKTMKDLKIPPRFVPYMEKHRIYELFHDLAHDLAVTRPNDPLNFIKTCLEEVEFRRDKRVVILIAPPFIDRIKLAHLISGKTGSSILSRYICIKNPCDYHSPIILARSVLDYLETADEKKDYILADFPDTAEEAKELIKEGVLPSHVFLFEVEDKIHETARVPVYVEKEEKLKKLDTTPSLLMSFNNDIHRLKELYKSSLKIVKIKDKSLEELADACAKVVKHIPGRLAPKILRVALLGPRGSRRRTIARLLSRQLNLVHVDMERLLHATRVSKTAEGDELRYLDRNCYNYSLKIVFNILKARLYKEDCMKRGYVLTNFPTSVEDFVLLDSIDTPPNRVIFLQIDETECQERLEDRGVDMHTGKLHSKKRNQKNPHVVTHPDDESCKVENEIRFYNERVGEMMEYCGKTAFLVDGRGPVTALLERIEHVLMSPSPVAPPRSGKLPPRLSRRSESSSSSQLGFPPPPSVTTVVPMIESAELLRRFSDLKKRIQIRRESSSSSDEGDLIMRELDREFALALMGGDLSKDDVTLQEYTY